MEAYKSEFIEFMVENDFFGMAAEMGFMLVIGIFPFMLFLTALFGWLGKHSFMNPLIVFLQQVMPGDVINLIETVLNEVWFFTKGGLVALFSFVMISSGKYIRSSAISFKEYTILYLCTNLFYIFFTLFSRLFKMSQTFPCIWITFVI